MRSVLTVIDDEALLNRIKLILCDNTVQYYYAENGNDVSEIAGRQEIAVAIIDYGYPIISGEELCEMILAFNPETQIILYFNESDTKDVLRIYNQYHINKLLCNSHLVLEDLPALIDSCFHFYNRDDEIMQMDSELSRLNDKYLQPMNEMSSILNERLYSYDSVNRVFRSSISFALNASEKALNSIDSFVDRIINDYIQIFMIKEPDAAVYLDRINDSFNNPEARKYFKFVADDVTVPDELKSNLLFILDVLTIGFDTFYPYYRGKLSITNVDNGIEVNSIYDVRRDPDFADIYDYMNKALEKVLSGFATNMKFGKKDSLIQFKALVS